jgi:4-diphosphocytidyl-2-C-methyl-D-erythritol kinase
MTLVEIAPLKINLFLHVVGRRSDGYHLLQSLFVFADIGDHIGYQPTDEPLTLDVVGPFASHLQNDPQNLVLRAARLLNPAATGRLQLDKQAPVASGLGGGSADAAATLRLLNRAWECGHSPNALRQLGASLGADVPACIASQPVFVAGIGDQLWQAAPGTTLPLLLVNPGVATSTPFVFKAFRDIGMDFSQTLENWPDVLPPWQQCHNDLGAAAEAVTPEIIHVLEELRGAKGVEVARMSGSGASCFATFGTLEDAKAAATELKMRQPGWWMRPTTVVVPDGLI